MVGGKLWVAILRRATTVLDQIVLKSFHRLNEERLETNRARGTAIRPPIPGGPDYGDGGMGGRGDETPPRDMPGASCSASIKVGADVTVRKLFTGLSVAEMASVGVRRVSVGAALAAAAYAAFDGCVEKLSTEGRLP